MPLTAMLRPPRKGPIMRQRKPLRSTAVVAGVVCCPMPEQGRNTKKKIATNNRNMILVLAGSIREALYRNDLQEQIFAGARPGVRARPRSCRADPCDNVTLFRDRRSRASPC